MIDRVESTAQQTSHKTESNSPKKEVITCMSLRPLWLHNLRQCFQGSRHAEIRFKIITSNRLVFDKIQKRRRIVVPADLAPSPGCVRDLGCSGTRMKIGQAIQTKSQGLARAL